jgi:hypothetical protein
MMKLLDGKNGMDAKTTEAARLHAWRFLMGIAKCGHVQALLPFITAPVDWWEFYPQNAVVDLLWAMLERSPTVDGWAHSPISPNDHDLSLVILWLHMDPPRARPFVDTWLLQLYERLTILSANDGMCALRTLQSFIAARPSVAWVLDVVTDAVADATHAFVQRFPDKVHWYEALKFWMVLMEQNPSVYDSRGDVLRKIINIHGTDMLPHAFRFMMKWLVCDHVQSCIWV